MSYPPFDINKDNVKVLEFLELIKYMHHSDYNMEKTKNQILDLIKKLDLNKKEIVNYCEYYNGKRYAGFRETVRRVVHDEVASQ